jgi:hypothetical protein
VFAVDISTRLVGRNGAPFPIFFAGDAYYAEEGADRDVDAFFEDSVAF